MSRIRLQPNDNHANREIGIYIGWEPALKTYFAQVFDGIDADGEEIMPVDLGNDPREIHTPDAAIEALRPYADIPDDLYQRLLAGRHLHDMTYTNHTRDMAQPLDSANPAAPAAAHQTELADNRQPGAGPATAQTSPVPVFGRPTLPPWGGLDR